MVKVGILGASGYAGAELVRLLSQRDDVEIIFIDSNSREGIPLEELYPNLFDVAELSFTSIDFESNEYFDQIDVLFCALPHGLTQKAVIAARDKGIKVVDLSADFRISDPSIYEEWYETKHIALKELEEAVYGMPELNRKKIKEAQLIANPGCYPTSIILGLMPLFNAGYAPKGTVISDSKSSISGAGRSLKEGNLFAQMNENITPYSIGVHRHTPEVKEQLSTISGQEMDFLFVPHLIPMNRGILSTIYVPNEYNLTKETVYSLYKTTYESEYFVRILPLGKTPQTKAVSGSNFCDIAVTVDDASGMIVVTSVIDNLIKGAAGQAVQNFNLMMGFNENKGLTQLSVWP